MRFSRKKALLEIHKVFPKAKISSTKRLTGGLMNKVYRVHITNPNKTLVVRMAKSKYHERIATNNKILNYLSAYIPTPRLLSESFHEEYSITLMTFLKGRSAISFYNKSTKKVQERILHELGKHLKVLHSLRIPRYWSHFSHKIPSTKEWRSWTKNRSKKYLAFAKSHLSPEEYKFVKAELSNFNVVLEKTKFKLVPLHWDFHLGNVSAMGDGKVTGIFDFDCAMKGHALSDVGQFYSTLILKTRDPSRICALLKAYNPRLTKNDEILIQGYALLHDLAVLRSNFHKERLKWLMDKYVNNLQKRMRGEFSFS